MMTSDLNYKEGYLRLFTDVEEIRQMAQEAKCGPRAIAALLEKAMQSAEMACISERRPPHTGGDNVLELRALD